MQPSGTFKDLMRGFRAAFDYCAQSGMDFTVGNCRKALREVDAGFDSEYVLYRFGLKFSDLKRHFIYGAEIKPKTAKPQLLDIKNAIDDFSDMPVEHDDCKAAWDLLSQTSEVSLEMAQRSMFRTVELKDKGPVGLIFMGDMHVGSASCLMDRIAWVMDLVRNSKVPLYVIQIGDLLDNMHWHSEEMAASGAPIPVHIRAAIHWLREVSERLIAVVAGNHDNWTYAKTGLDLLDHVMTKAGVEIPYHRQELILDVMLGKVEYRLVLRHAVRGSSQYNNAHGVLRWLIMHDTHYDADLVAAGHVHKSGYAHRKVHGRDRHGLQLGTYKDRDGDEYAVKGGWVDGNDSPDMLAILHPDRKEIQVFEDTEVGLTVLEALWRAKESSKPSPRGKTK